MTSKLKPSNLVNSAGICATDAPHIVVEKLDASYTRAVTAVPTRHPDNAAVDNFATRMRVKLAQKRNEGRGGWQNMLDRELSAILRHCVEKGDPVDVANLCMMLSENGQRISPAETERPCTCHPDDNPHIPCAGKYALNECSYTEPAQGEEFDINTYRDLAVNAIEDLKNYANDENGARLMVSYNGYIEDLERIDRADPASKEGKS